MRPAVTAIAGVSTLLLSLSLTACQGSNAPVGSQAASPAATDVLAQPGDPTGSTEQTGPAHLTDPTQAQEPARPTEAAQPDAPECSGLTGEEAMTAHIIDGKALAAHIRTDVTHRVAVLKAQVPPSRRRREMGRMSVLLWTWGVDWV